MENKKPNKSNQAKNLEQGLNIDNFKSSMRRDFKELKEFFLDEERLGKLEKKSKFKRGLFTSFWLLKALFLKLSVMRRVLLLFALFLMMIQASGPIGNSRIHFDGLFKMLGGMVLLFILMLELKDKLLAHDELAAGRQVQLALMPGTNPKIPGWDAWLYSQPANDVGGDLVDFIQLDKDRFGLALGDVAGKGLPAALLMAKLQATLRALVTEFDSLDELGAKINKIFHRDSISRSFASLVYVELIASTGNLHLLNAGHPPPLVLSQGNIQPTEKGNLGLGILAKAVYSSREIQLKQDDILLIYSDGVTEAQNEQEEFFGNQRLLDLLAGLTNPSVSEVGESILQAVASFVGEAPCHDDLSLLILKRR